MKETTISKGLNSLKHEVAIGNVYFIQLSEEDGVKITDNKTKKIKKFFVVVGIDDNGNAYGGTLINSHHPFQESHILFNYQWCVQATKNGFLKYDSYIHCGKLFEVSCERVTIDFHVGYLDEYSLENVINKILCKNNPTLEPYKIKKYNITPYVRNCT